MKASSYRTSALFISLFLISLSLFTSCTESNDGTGTLEIRMTDNPADFSAVNVDIQRVEIHRSGDSPTGWVVINDEPIKLNLLELVNGADTLIGNKPLDAGKYTQLRLILGPDNTLVKDGDTLNLTVPSGQQSGLKLNIDAEVETDINYTLLLDFNAAQSIVTAGNGNNGPSKYLLKPVIRAVNEAMTGGISGTVSPPEASGLVYTVAAGDTISTYAEVDTGEFKLIGIPDGNYILHAESSSEVFDSVQVQDVQVVPGGSTNIGIIELSTQQE